jgi:hypothetical protein
MEGINESNDVPATASQSQTPSSPFTLSKAAQGPSIVGDHEYPELSTDLATNPPDGQGDDLTGLELPVLEPVADEDEEDGSIDGGDYSKGEVVKKGALGEIPDSDAVSPPSSMQSGLEDGTVGEMNAKEIVEEGVMGDVVKEGAGVESVTTAKAEEHREIEEGVKNGAELTEMKRRGDTAAMADVEEGTPMEPTFLKPASSESISFSLETATHAERPVLEEELYQLDNRLVPPTPAASGAHQSSLYNQDKIFEDAFACTDATKDDSAQSSKPTVPQSEADSNSEDSRISVTEGDQHLLSPSPEVLDPLTAENVMLMEGALFLRKALLVDEALATKEAASVEDVQSVKNIPPREIPPSDDEDGMDGDTDPLPNVFEFHTAHGSSSENTDTLFMNVQPAGAGERPVLVVPPISDVETRTITEAAAAETMDIALFDSPHLDADDTTTMEVAISLADLHDLEVTSLAQSSEAMDVEKTVTPHSRRRDPERTEAPTSPVKQQKPSITTQGPSSASMDAEIHDASALRKGDPESTEDPESPPTMQDLSAVWTLLAPSPASSAAEIITTQSRKEELPEPEPEPEQQLPKRGRGRHKKKGKEKAVEPAPETEGEVEVETKPEPKPEVKPEPGSETRASSTGANKQSPQASPLVQEPQVSIAPSTQQTDYDAQVTEIPFALSKLREDSIPSNKTVTVTPNSPFTAPPSESKHKERGSGAPAQMAVKPCESFTAPDGSQNKTKLGTTIPLKVSSSPKASLTAADGSRDKDVLFDELKAMKIVCVPSSRDIFAPLVLIFSKGFHPSSQCFS